jgi:hypothetical protein
VRTEQEKIEHELNIEVGSRLKKRGFLEGIMVLGNSDYATVPFNWNCAVASAGGHTTTLP